MKQFFQGVQYKAIKINTFGFFDLYYYFVQHLLFSNSNQGEIRSASTNILQTIGVGMY